MLWYNIFIFIISAVILAFSASMCVKALSSISRFLKMNEFIVGFIIMGISTTLPELFVGINSALNKNPALSMGNVIGSVIVNFTLILGIVIVLAKGINTTKGVIKRDAIKLLAIIVVPVILNIIGRGLSRIDGVILLLIFVWYIVGLYKERGKYSLELKNTISKKEGILSSFLFLISLVVLFFSARSTAVYGGIIAGGLGLPNIFIGLFFVAVSTSLPELTFGIIAARTNHSIMSLGNLMGAGIINVTLVLGITALIEPIKSNFTLFLTSSIFMIITCFIFSVFIETGRKLYWKEGIALIFLYIFFLIVELSLSGIIK